MEFKHLTDKQLLTNQSDTVVVDLYQEKGAREHREGAAGSDVEGENQSGPSDLIDFLLTSKVITENSQ